jgi:outer membrane lipoprotein LolB
MLAGISRPAGIILALLMTGLSGCAPLTTHHKSMPGQPDIAWESRQQLLSSIHQWQTDGRLAIKTTSDAWSASIDWQQHNDAYRIRLSGPFGSQAMHIEGDASRVLLKKSSDEVYAASNAASLIERHTGWTVPVEGLRYWALGLPDPQLHAQRVVDEYGRLTRLEQSGWVIEYTAYITIDGIDLPRIIRLENSFIKAKIVFKNWQINRQTLS